jgi:hypothetical protein
MCLLNGFVSSILEYCVIGNLLELTPVGERFSAGAELTFEFA